MRSYQAEIMVKKDDPLNAQDVYLDGFMYVGDSRDIELPLYFAPEFTQKCVGKVKGVQERGIKYFSRVIRVIPTTAEQIKRDPEAIVDDQIKGDKLWQHWQRGLQAIAARARDERWPDKHKNLLYFLSRPVKLPHTVVTGLDKIPPGYKTTMLDLLTKRNLYRE